MSMTWIGFATGGKCPVRDIKNRILEFSKPPILEFKRLQKAFKIKEQGLKYLLK